MSSSYYTLAQIYCLIECGEEGVTIFEGNGRRGRKEVIFYAAFFFFVIAFRDDRKKAAYETRDEDVFHDDWGPSTDFPSLNSPWKRLFVRKFSILFLGIEDRLRRGSLPPFLSSHLLQMLILLLQTYPNPCMELGISIIWGAHNAIM